MASETEDVSEEGESGCATYGKWGCGCLTVGLVILVSGSLGSLIFSTYPVASWGVVVSAALLFAGAVAGVFVGSYALGGPTSRRMEVGGRVLLAFGVACLLTVIGLTLRPSRFQYDAETPPEGGIVGPIEVPYEDMRVAVQVRQSIEGGVGSRFQRWSFVTVELLDADKNYLSSFGGEFWHYAGYDDGHWEEDDEEYRTTLEMPSSGTYYARLQTEANVDTGELSPVYIEMYEQAWWGNPIPVRFAAYLAFFFGGILIVAPRVGMSERLLSHLEEGGKVRYGGQTWRVGGQLHCDYGSWVADEWSLQPTGPGAKTPRYLEREYETDSNWESWLISRPVALDELRGHGPNGDEMTVQRYASSRGDLPKTVTVEDRQYELEDTGRVRREGTPIRYHNYEGTAGDFVTIEGTPGESLDAVVGETISVSELTIVEGEAETV